MVWQWFDCRPWFQYLNSPLLWNLNLSHWLVILLPCSEKALDLDKFAQRSEWEFRRASWGPEGS